MTLTLHNAARARHGLPALVADARLASAAHVHAAECARWGTLDHAGWAAEIRAAGYPATAAIAQNLEEGSPDAAGAFAVLLADPPHAATILGGYARMGAGMAVGGGQVWWCCNYGS